MLGLAYWHIVMHCYKASQNRATMLCSYFYKILGSFYFMYLIADRSCRKTNALSTAANIILEFALIPFQTF